MKADFAITCNRTKRAQLASLTVGVAALPALLPAVSAGKVWQWETIGQDGGPEARSSAVVAWTGKELLVWGGREFGIDTPYLNDGWRYDPESDTWTPMSGEMVIALDTP